MTEPDFRKTFFFGRKCRKYAGKLVFLAISRAFIISFFQFLVETFVINNQTPIGSIISPATLGHILDIGILHQRAKFHEEK